MTIAKKRQASNILEKKKLIQDIKQKNPEISEAQLSRYNIDDLKKIQMAVGQEYYKDALEKEKGLRLGLNRQKMKYGGKMKKKYQSQGEVRGIGAEGLATAELYGKSGFEPSEIKRGEPSSLSEIRAKAVQGHLGEYDTVAKMRKYLFEQEFGRKDDIWISMSKKTRDSMVKDLVNEVNAVKKGTLRAIEERSKPQYQYGGMADMSAAPMIKQPQRKKRKASGFRTKYSKGGGVRSSKYKL